MAESSTRKQNIVVLTVAAAIILLSVVMTLLFSGRFLEGLLFDSSNKGYQNITFTDAVITCRERTESQFGRRLRTLELDNHSSRFDEREFVYKIFIRVETPAAKAGGLTQHYVNCFVKSSSGRIGKFEAWEDRQEKVSPVTEDDTNMFGWPR
jgi:hypothetical protein